MHGAPLEVPYGAEDAIMRRFGWSWQDLQQAPLHFVMATLTRMSAENKWQAKKNELDANRPNR